MKTDQVGICKFWVLKNAVNYLVVIFLKNRFVLAKNG